MPPMRHAPAGIGRARGATSVAPIQVVLHRPDDLLRSDVFLAATQHQLMLRFSVPGSRLGQLTVQLRQAQG